MFSISSKLHLEQQAAALHCQYGTPSSNILGNRESSLAVAHVFGIDNSSFPQISSLRLSDVQYKQSSTRVVHATSFVYKLPDMDLLLTVYVNYC